MTGKQFKAARLALGLTQNALAKVLDIDKRTIGRFESAEHAVPETTSLAVQHLSCQPKEKSTE